MKFRIEKDILGKVKVPANAYYGIFTVRASRNFPISGMRINSEMNRALIQIKMAAAHANISSKALNKRIGNAIIKACQKILKDYSKYENQFIIDIYQAGAGTPWHMNVNEVIANVSLEILRKRKGNYSVVDPHDHVNLSQSSNDVIPTGIKIASLFLTDKLIQEVRALIQTLKRKGKEFRNLAKAGRTHLRDAVPITLGMEFYAWASDLEKRLQNIEGAKRSLQELQIGGTAVGTGINASSKFSALIIKYLKKQTSLPLISARNKVQQTEFATDFLDLSAVLRSIATDLNKISNDIRLLSSGPMTGLNEIDLPQVEPGSSIMPSKFNPSMAEMLNMVCFQVIGNDATIQQAAQSGELDLNVMTPVIAHNLLQSLEILTNGIREFNNRCVKGIKANKEVLQSYFEKTPAVGTVLNQAIGYDKTAEVIKEAIKRNKSVKSIVIEKGLLNQKEANRLLSKKSFKL